MQLRNKLILAGLVLATGVSSAMWFRKPRDENASIGGIDPLNRSATLRETASANQPEWNKPAPAGRPGTASNSSPAWNTPLQDSSGSGSSSTISSWPPPPSSGAPSDRATATNGSQPAQLEGGTPVPSIAPNFQPAFNIGSANSGSANSLTGAGLAGTSGLTKVPSGAAPWETEPRKETAPVSFAPATQPSPSSGLKSANAAPSSSPFSTSSIGPFANNLSVEAPIRHKLKDGDSLAALSEHYLGNASRRLEIFEANRDVLRNPDILPIGTEIKIPPKMPAATVNPFPARNDESLPPLTPVGKVTVGNR